MSKDGTSEFSRWRTIIWPVHSYELMKLIPMLLVSFLISFNYNILRVMKDTLILTAGREGGAEIIPFIKVWVMLPGAILLTALFSYASNRFSRERVIYTMIGVFLVYFFIFTFLLFPICDSLHLDSLADYLKQILPLGFKGMINMIRYWSFTSFYVMSELWSSIILSLIFWGLAVQVTQLKEAKRFYGVFGIGANISGIFAGEISALITRIYGQEGYHNTLIILVSFVLIAGIITMSLIRWLHVKVFNDTRYHQGEADTKFCLKGSKKLSVKENLSYVLRSKYLTNIAVIVVAYNIIINLVEVVWKQQVKDLYPNSSDYQIYMAHVTTIIGIVATLSAAFVSGNSIRKYGWTFTALISPVILFITSVVFFFFFFMNGRIEEFTTSLLGLTPLAVVVFLGTTQNVLSRAAKYTVFDATKEVAFVPLTSECKMKGKAAIDGIGSRFGKSGGSAVHQFLLLMFVTINASAPYVAGVLFSIIAVWFGATRKLGKQFELVDGKEQFAVKEEKELVALVS